MNIHKPPKWLRFIYRKLQFSVPNETKKIYLSFDDGPTPKVTHWVLDQLAEYQAKATFFCIGKNVEKYPEIFVRIKAEGHSVGNHTYSHLNGWKTKSCEYSNDIELASYYIKSKLFRPPYGRIKQKQIKYLKKNNYKLFMWDVLSEDYNQAKTPEECLKYLIDYTEQGSIIVFHDSEKASKNLYEILPKILKFYKEKSYNFCSLK